jgi:hypothetical protein
MCTSYTECQAFCLVSEFGPSAPSPASECCSPLWVQGGRHTGMVFGELDGGTKSHRRNGNLLFQPKTTFEISISTFLRAGRAADGTDESVEFCWIQTTRTRAFEEPQVSSTKKQIRTVIYLFLFIY